MAYNVQDFLLPPTIDIDLRDKHIPAGNVLHIIAFSSYTTTFDSVMFRHQKKYTHYTSQPYTQYTCNEDH